MEIILHANKTRKRLRTNALEYLQVLKYWQQNHNFLFFLLIRLGYLFVCFFPFMISGGQ